MKTTMITAFVSALMAMGLATQADARPQRHHDSSVYVSGHRSCGTPIYSQRYVRGYDRFGNPIWRHRVLSSRDYRQNHHRRGHGYRSDRYDRHNRYDRYDRHNRYDRGGRNRIVIRGIFGL